MVCRRRPRAPTLPCPSHGTQRPIEASVRSRPSDPRQPLDSQRHQVLNFTTQSTRVRQIANTSPSQHYNKKLRTLSPATAPSTPIRSATKRKAPASKTANPSDSPTSAAERGRGKKKAAAAVKADSEEAAERDDDDDEERSPAKKAKVDVSESAGEGQE